MIQNRATSYTERFYNRIFLGWWVLIAGALINAVGVGVVYQGFTIFFLPLKRELALSSAAVSLVYGASRLEGGLEGPLVAYLINRFGPRKMIVCGVTLVGVGYYCFSMIHSYLMFFLIYVFVIALGSSAGFTHPVGTVITNWFIRRRGTAFGVTTAAGSFGGMVMAPILSHFALNYSWRVAAVVAGSVILAFGLPSSVVMYRTPEEKGLKPDGESMGNKAGAVSTPSESRSEEVDITVKEALKSYAFYLLSLCISLRILVTVALSAHMIPILVWKGMSEAGAAYLVSLYAFLAIIGMLVMGWVGDRFPKQRICSLCLAFTGACLLWISVSTSKAVFYMPPIALAVSMSTVPLNWSLIGDFFGRRSYASLRGVTIVPVGIATFISPLFAGWVFDHTESYSIVLITFSGILFVCSGMFAALRPPVPRSGYLAR